MEKKPNGWTILCKEGREVALDQIGSILKTYKKDYIHVLK